MNALSLDLRQRIVSSVDAGMPQAEAARRFCVSSKTVARLLMRRRESGTLAAKARPGRERRVGVERQGLVAVQLRAYPHESLAEHALRWQHEQGQSLSATTLWRTLRRMGWSHKKRVSRPASGTRSRVRPGAGVSRA